MGLVKHFFLIQVVLVAFFFVLIFRKYNEKSDIEFDPDDDGGSLNKFKKMDPISEVNRLKLKSRWFIIRAKIFVFRMMKFT